MDELVKLKDVLWQLRALQNECPGFGFFGRIAIERIESIPKVERTTNAPVEG